MAQVRRLDQTLWPILLLSIVAYLGCHKLVAPKSQRYKLVFTVPKSHAEVTKAAVFEAGGGVYAEGKYKEVSSSLVK